MPDPRAASEHYKDARQQAMASVTNTSIDPLIKTEIGLKDIKIDVGFEKGIKDMLNNFFVMFYPKKKWQ